MGLPRTRGQHAPKPTLRRAASVLALATVCLEPALLSAQAYAAATPTRSSSRSKSGSRAGDRRVHVEITPWEAAERSRDAFESVPENSRTHAQYQNVIERYRTIYHLNPADPHAPEAINAVAELLAESGRDLHDRGSFEAAVGQYDFLRTQYPGSSLRVGALLAQGQIAENDLHDPILARTKYQLLLKSYPHSALAEQARAGIASLAHRQHPTSAVAGNAPPPSLGDTLAQGRPTSSPESTRPATQAPAPVVRSRPASAEPVHDPAALPPPHQVAHRSGPLASVSGIRHWSTASYTRVAIDLGDEVQYEAARVPSPDRIFFDLHGAHLAADLVGKSFAVTDDGFLKRIRVSQSAPDVARVVLDVNDVTEYSAFLLPNPYRLIIDIHGRRESAPTQQLATVDTPAARTAAVPNTHAVRAGSPADVNTLSEQPGKIEATSNPTSQPIAATVSGRERSAELSQPVSTASTLPASSPTSAGVAQKSTSSSSRPETSPRHPEVGPSAAGANSATAADGRVVGDPSPAATARAVASAKKASRKGSKSTVVADSNPVADPATPARAALKTADGQTSLVRALGLKINRIVIDAGHGGHDSGTLGVDGLQEKDVVLDVALRLGTLLHDKLGAEVIYTRSDDTFIPLETRTAIANKAQADLFLSVHANSSPDSSARGVETYYLNFTQQADALEVAARENAVSGQSIHQLSDLVRKITLKDKIAESREFATDVEGSLFAGLARAPENLRANVDSSDRLKDRGVKKAPFVVLIGANMPSILAEISFVTNPRDAAQLRQPEYKQRVAESLYKGVARYVGSLSSTGPALPTERAAATTGQ